MAFPSDLNPTLKTDWANNTPVEDTHPEEHNDVASNVEALKAKVGADGSAVTTSHDYKLSGVTGSDKAASLTGSETLSGKTLTAPKLVNGGFIADENGNELVEGTTVVSATNHVGVSNNSTGNAPIVEAKGSDTNIDLSVKGKGTGSVKLGTAGLKFPNVDGSANQVIVTDGAGNLSFASASSNTTYPATFFSGITGGSGDSIPTQYCDSTQFAYATKSSNSIYYMNSLISGGIQIRSAATDWASVDDLLSAITLGVYLYVLMRDVSNNYRLYRYAVGSLSSGGTLMTISGQAFSTTGGSRLSMTSNGTNFYINYKGGNSSNDYVISKYTLSGTTLTYVSDITCGASSNVTNQLLMVDSSENIYGRYRSVDIGGDNKIRKYNSSGTLQFTTEGYNSGGIWRGVFSYNNIPYLESYVNTGAGAHTNVFYSNRIYL